MRNKKTITAYKGFDKDLKCRDFQYEIGKEYEIDGEIKVCEKGFHACENPLEVFNYYLLDKDCDLARFCEVEQSGNIDKENSTTKICSSKIKIKAELKLANIIKAGVEWIKEKVKQNNLPSYSGDYAKIGSSGDSAQIGSSGYYAKIGSSGDYAKIGSSGYYAKIGSSGYYAKIGSSGDYAQIGSSGYYAKIGSSGKDCVICCAGRGSIVKAKIGSWITLAEWKNNKPVCVKTEYVDGKRIKEDTWYKLINGEFVEETI